MTLMIVNEAMKLLTADIDLTSVTPDDVPQPLRGALSEGWVCDDGAWLLRDLLRNYRGARSNFTDLTGYEAAVNGRSIPDYDLDVADPRRTEIIFRRSFAFTCSALALLNEIAKPPPVVAYIVMGESLTEQPALESHTTFCLLREDEAPYLEEIQTYGPDAVMMVELSDCVGWKSKQNQ